MRQTKKAVPAYTPSGHKRGDDVSENAASAQPKPFSPPRKDNRLTKQQIISIVFSLITGSAVAANPPYPNIVQYGEATAVRHEHTQALYQAMHAAVQQSYDLAQYDIAVRPCRDADNALYHCVSFTLKNQDPKQRGGKGNFAVQIRHSDGQAFFIHAR